MKKPKPNAIPRGQTPERRAYMKAYRESHPPRNRRAYKAAYDEANREKNAAYRAANAARLKAKAEAYYRANRESILTRVRAYTEANKERILAYHVGHYVANAERIKANVAAYRKANPEKKAHLENRRRARKANNGGSHTLAERLEKFARLGNVCFYCGGAKKLTVDHNVPLARGGTDNIGNILPACRSCNSKKNARTALEFIWISKTGGVGSNSADR